MVNFAPQILSLMERRDVEIMAPVGSYESLMAAIQGGAGSVYFGVEHLSMRSRSANNFTLDDLKKIVEIASKNKVKTLFFEAISTIFFKSSSVKLFAERERILKCSTPK